MASQLRLTDSSREVFSNALAMDVSFKEGHAFAAGVLYDIRQCLVLDVFHGIYENDIPYVPGYFAFREVPFLLRIINRMKTTPDCILCDGHGVMHPRRAGLASQMGWLTGLPSAGVAKKHLYGRWTEPGPDKYAYSTVHDKEGGMLGYVFRNRAGAKPVFISPGDYISFEKSLETVKLVSGKYRIPEPLHLADRESKSLKKQFFGG